MSRTFVLGDPHGGLKALLQVLERSGFDKEEDILVCLGDVADGWPEVAELVEELLTIKNLIPIIGNHDYWLKCYLECPQPVDIWREKDSTYKRSPDYWVMICREQGYSSSIWVEDYLMYRSTPNLWLSQGGEASYESYLKNMTLRVKHRSFYFSKCLPYYIDRNNNAYVHGGYRSKNGLGYDDNIVYTWDRDLWAYAKSAAPGNGHLNMTKMYNKLFIGHTSMGANSLPQKRCNVWNLDTGAGWEGKLTLMNVETEEYFMSDRVKDLYPNVKGR